ncbi:MAG TPA: transposase [Vicinamibacteria bacterium]
MARPLRIEFPGALYHVTSRGNARESIFLDDGDRQAFLGRLGEVAGSHRWRCFSYCLMTNHFHLLLETPEPNLSRGMRLLNGRYSQRFNRRHGRVGHVLQGRFKGILVEREAHLVELARYVVLNPVRAGMVAAAEDYPWSSLRATLGLAPPPSWLVIEGLLARFGSRSRYLQFVGEGVGAPSPWSSLRGGLLGSDVFVERLAGRLERRAVEGEFPRRERLVHRETLNAAFPPPVLTDRTRRDERIRELAASGRFTAAEIGRHLGLHYSTISKIAARPAIAAAAIEHQIQDSRSDPLGA